MLLLGVFFVFFFLLTWLTTNLSNYLRARTAALPSVTHDELLSIVEPWEKKGELPEVEKDIIGNTLNFEIEV